MPHPDYPLLEDLFNEEDYPHIIGKIVDRQIERLIEGKTIAGQPDPRGSQYPHLRPQPDREHR